MRRKIFLVGVGLVTASLSVAQVKKQFSIDNIDNVDKVDLNFSSASGSCYIKPHQKSELLNVYGNLDADSYAHSFDKAIDNKVCSIDLALNDDKDDNGIGQSISYRMFGSSKSESSKLWKVFLTEGKLYDLNLKYGVGMADIDLSGLSVNKLKINTGSADVNIGYLSDKGNQVSMDTFKVDVDMGTVNVKRINMSKASHVLADIGFGNLSLDFSDKPEVKSNIVGSVGAGKLVIVLPEEDTPVIVKVNDSWLCRVKLSKSFVRKGHNTYVSKTYDENAPNLLSFDLDVSMGSIVFKEN